MDILKVIKGLLIKGAPKLNLCKTIVVNFKLLPTKQAMKLPIFMYGKWNLRKMRGKIIIESDEISTGMLKFGNDTAGYFTSAISTLNMFEGSVLHISEGVRIGQGVQICLLPKAKLILKKRAAVNDNVKVICSTQIEIGEQTSVTWECQIMDYNSHYVLDTSTNRIANISKPVVIGDYCWVCNRSTIMPGTVLPNRTIVASGSLLNRDYIRLGIREKSMIGGSPAKLIKEGVYRLYKKDSDKKIKQYFKDNADSPFYELSSEDNFEE